MIEIVVSRKTGMLERHAHHLWIQINKLEGC